MDENVTAIFENVTAMFLNEQFEESMEVDEVSVIFQRVIEEPVASEKPEEEIRKLQLRRESFGRTLGEGSTKSSLSIRLGVKGTMLDWQAFGSDSVSDAILESLSSNDFETSLADASDFFPYETSNSRVSKATVVVDPEPKNPGHIVLIVFGAIVAAAVVVGSMIRGRSTVSDIVPSSKKRRQENLGDRANKDAMQVQAYDLNDLDGEEDRKNLEIVKNEENVLDSNARSPSAKEESKESPNKAPIEESPRKVSKKESPRKASRKQKTTKDPRTTSLLDNVSSVVFNRCIDLSHVSNTPHSFGIVQHSYLSSLFQTDSGDTEEKNEISALDLSPEALKAAIKKKTGNIFVFTDGHKRAAPSGPAITKEGSGDADELEIKQSVSSLSNPSQIEELTSPSPRAYLGDHFNYTNVEKLIGDQYDTRAIMTPFTPKGNSGNATPSRRTNYSFSSPVNSVSRTRTARKDKLFDVYAPPGPLGIIIDTTPEGPMIHSLKPTSQLLGLVNPGDLIVGLDGVDTRNMTAATFTRLMAKRSQGERKITLLKGLAPMTPTGPMSMTPR